MIVGLVETGTINRLYELAVSAFTDAGEGLKSSWEEARTRPKSVPNIMETPTVKVIFLLDVYFRGSILFTT